MQQNFWKENSIMSSWQNLRCHIVRIYIEVCPHLFILDMHGCNELKQRAPIKGSTKHKPHLQLHVLGQSLTQPRLADTEFTFFRHIWPRAKIHCVRGSSKWGKVSKQKGFAEFVRKRIRFSREVQSVLRIFSCHWFIESWEECGEVIIGWDIVDCFVTGISEAWRSWDNRRKLSHPNLGVPQRAKQIGFDHPRSLVEME